MPSRGWFDGLPSVHPRTVALVLAAGILLLSVLGPESYRGVDVDLITTGIMVVFILWLVARGMFRSGTGVVTDPETPGSVGEHYRSTDDVAAVYRVVGSGDNVTLLRVTDADGRRRHTGEIRHVDQETLDSDFEAASDPDARRSPVAAVRNLLSGLYWSVRRLF